MHYENVNQRLIYRLTALFFFRYLPASEPLSMLSMFSGPYQIYKKNIEKENVSVVNVVMNATYSLKFSVYVQLHPEIRFF